MYYEEEINIVGIIPESELTEYTSKKEMEQIIYDTLGLGPIYEPLILALESKGMLSTKTNDIK